NPPTNAPPRQQRHLQRRLGLSETYKHCCGMMLRTCEDRKRYATTRRRHSVCEGATLRWPEFSRKIFRNRVGLIIVRPRTARWGIASFSVSEREQAAGAHE